MRIKIKYIFLCPGYGYISMTQKSMNEHVEHIHTDLSLPQDQDGKKCGNIYYRRGWWGAGKRRHVVKFHENMSYFFALIYKLGKGSYPNEIVEGAATASSRINTSRWTTATKDCSEAALARPSQGSPSPTE